MLDLARSFGDAQKILTSVCLVKSPKIYSTLGISSSLLGF